MYFLTDRTAQTTAFDTVVEIWLERKVAQTVNASVMQDQSAMQEDLNLYSKVLYRLSCVPSPPPERQPNEVFMSTHCKCNKSVPVLYLRCC